MSTSAPARRSATPGRSAEAAKLQRITRLLALAIKFDALLAERKMVDYADLSRLGKVTRARMTQIMNLLNLAPDIQEEILFLPGTAAGRDIITERDLREVTRLVDWERQRMAWRKLIAERTAANAGTGSARAPDQSAAGAEVIVVVKRAAQDSATAATTG